MIRNSKFIRLQFQILTGIDSDPRSPVVFDRRRDRDHETAADRHSVVRHGASHHLPLLLSTLPHPPQLLPLSQRGFLWSNNIPAA